MSLRPVVAGLGRSFSQSFQQQQESEIRLKKEQQEQEFEVEKQRIEIDRQKLHKLHIQICEDLYPFGSDQLKECTEEILRELK
jgi:hypothetical protein